MSNIKQIQASGQSSIRAKFDTGSINEEKRTVDLTFVTEREVVMYNYRQGLIREVLVCEDGAGDLSRLNNGAPLLDSHNSYSVKNALGVVERAWFEGGKGKATVRFSKNADIESVWQNVKDGILRGVSVGYNPTTYEITETEGEMPLCRAIKWEALEISIALVQADIDSAIGRSKNENLDKHTITLISNKMDETTEVIPAANEAAQAANEAATNAARAAATNLEKTRSKEILRACRSVNLPAEFAEGLIGQDITIDQARGLVIDEVAKNKATNASNNVQTTVSVNADETDKFRSAAEIGMCLRSSKMQEKDFTTEQVSTAREFRGMSLADVARDCLVRSNIVKPGEAMRMSATELYKRSISITSSSSDFPVILEGTARRVLLAAYKSIPDTWRMWCAIGSVPDFRKSSRIRLGAMTRLDAVTENGEIKTKPLNDGTAETVQAKTYANIVSLSRVMMVNDDLDAFTRIPHDLGRAAARGIEVDAYALLAANPVMADGFALFSAQHGNLATPGAITVATLEAMRVLMAKQKDPNGQDFLDLRASILLTDIGIGADAKIINSSTYDPDTPNKLQRPNSAKGLFKTIIDSPRIATGDYYAFVDPSDEAVIEVSFLNGVQTPYLEQEESFDQLGYRWRIYHDYGVGAVGYRGAVWNAGS